MASLPARTALALALALYVAAPAVAYAQDPKPGALADAAEKWEQGLLTEALPVYEKALADGGLFPADVVLAYSRIGTVHAASGRKEAALSAFRVAAIIDPAFQLPLESGPVARKLYDQARSQAQKQGGKLDVAVEAPDKVDAGKGFSVTAKLPEAFAPVVEKVGIEVKDTMAKPIVWKSDAPATASVQFDVPGKSVQGGTTLMLRVSALDQHGNRWALKEVRVKVREGEIASPVFVEPKEGDEKKEETSSGGFWSSPWPYVIGGAIVAGAVTTFLLTRPSDQVSVGAPTWAR